MALLGQTSIARTTSLTCSIETDTRYESRPSLSRLKTSGASCSQKPNRAHLAESTLTMTSSRRGVTPTFSPTTRRAWTDCRVVLAHRPAAINQAPSTAPQTGVGATSEPEIRMCAASSMKATWLSECSARHRL